MLSLNSVRKLLPSVKEHRLVEAEVFRLLHETLDDKYIREKERPLGLLKYSQKHFFSSLFLALYRAVGIPEERRIFYGTINHSIRGIVTGTDNLLDDEYKEMLPLRFPESATKFKSVMHVLLFDRFLIKILEDAAAKGMLAAPQKTAVLDAVFRAMVPIGAEEASEEQGVPGILPPSEILSSVHMYKGGNLLRLAFVAPLLLEKDLQDPLERIDRGIYSIGLALQTIDDLTDFYDDQGKQRHNYLLSSIHHEGSPDERQRLDHLRSGRALESIPIEKAYRESVSRVMGRAIGEALRGFQLLHEAGFWVTTPQAFALIKQLFRLRGVASLLALLPENSAEALIGQGLM